MALPLDKRIHPLQVRRRLGRFPMPDGNLIEIYEDVDYCMVVGGKQFLCLDAPDEPSHKSDEEESLGEEETSSGKFSTHFEEEPDEDAYAHALFWSTFCTAQQFYLPSWQFYQDVQQLLDRKDDQGEVDAYFFGKNFSHRKFSLNDYLQRRASVQGFLTSGFGSIPGKLDINTPNYQLSLMQYERGKRVSVSTSADLSEVLAPLVLKTFPYQFQGEDFDAVRGAVSYLLREKVFKYSLH